jgi:hypothetical protein
MTKQEYLLQKLQEECAEVIQIASKINRFGLLSFNPDDPKKTTNSQLLAKEIIDLQTIISMVGCEGMMPAMSGREVGNALLLEEEKILEYMEISRNLGTLDKEPEQQTQPQD